MNPAAPEKISLSFVIPAYNEAEYLGRCLESVVGRMRAFKASPGGAGKEFEIIVADNASTDRTREIALHYPEAKLVEETRKSPTFARQAGLSRAKGELVAFLDADTKLPEGWFEKVFGEFGSDPSLVSLSGPFRYYDLPPLKRRAAETLWSIFAMPVYFFTRYMVLGANVVARREALLAIGGLNTDISFYGDDTDLARRLHSLGKVKFRMDFFIWGSGRRLADDLVATEIRYGLNFLWEVLFKKPFTREHKDVR